MSNFFENKVSTGLAFLIIIGITFPTAYIAYKSWSETILAIDIESETATTLIKSKKTNNISKKLKQQIQDWISKNDLNKYGDPKDTMYIGGSPLFNESTGEKIELYDYILEKHPDKPWNNQTNP